MARAYIVTEGRSDSDLLRRILPGELSHEVDILEAGGISSVKSMARSLLVTRRKPVAIVVDADSDDRFQAGVRFRDIEEVVEIAAPGVPVKVLVAVPELEAVLFQAPGLVARVFGDRATAEVMDLARRSPNQALGRLDEAGGVSAHQKILSQLTESDLAVIREAEVIRELIAFLHDVLDRVAGAANV